MRAQILGAGYHHGSHGEATAPGVGDWTLRTYRAAPRSWLANAQRLVGVPTEVAPGWPTAGILLPPYFCAVHVLALDLAQPPSAPPDCGQAPLPVATLPPWVCRPHRPQDLSRGVLQVDLKPSCSEQVLPLAGPADLRVSFSRLALIRRCRHQNAVRWIACMKNGPYFLA